MPLPLLPPPLSQVATSNWEAEQLSLEQIKYAACDVLATYHVHRQLRQWQLAGGAGALACRQCARQLGAVSWLVGGGRVRMMVQWGRATVLLPRVAIMWLWGCARAASWLLGGGRAGLVICRQGTGLGWVHCNKGWGKWPAFLSHPLEPRHCYGQQTQCTRAPRHAWCATAAAATE
jgi:hypothetical protein